MTIAASLRSNQSTPLSWIQEDGNFTTIVNAVNALIAGQSGQMTSEGPFVSGIGFTPGVSTSFVLSAAYASSANLNVHYDASYQGPDQYTVVGNILTFNAPVPVGVQVVYVIGGVTLPINVPANNSVGLSQLTLSVLNYFVQSAILSGVSGASLIGYTQGGTGSGTITQQAKNQQMVSVKEFNPFANGVTDDTFAFSAAAQAVFANALTTNTTVTTSQFCRVFVPAGTYLLSSQVNCAGRSVDWVLDDAAVVTNLVNLGGRITRGTSSRTNRPVHYGCFDTANSLSVTANYLDDEPPAVIGISNNAQIASYASRDSVAVYIANTAPAIMYTLTAPNYTATTVTCPTPVNISKLRVGMFIDTAHATKYTGFITAWAPDGSSITVSAWYLNGGGAGTPANGINAFVNPITKIWGVNGGVTLNNSSYGNAASGYELDVYNTQGNSNAFTVSATGQTWGFDCTAGTFNCSAAYVARGSWLAGFVSASTQVGNAIGYRVVGTEITGFSHESTVVGGNAYKCAYNSILTYYVANTGQVNQAVDVATTAVQINKSNYVSGASFFQSFSLNGTLIGSISGNGSTTTYATTSDYRLKYNVEPMRNAIDSIMRLKPVTYLWEIDGSYGEGFIAHELQQEAPYCVVGEKDETDEHGVILPQRVDLSKLVGRLTAAIQDQQHMIDGLIRRLSYLESK